EVSLEIAVASYCLFKRGLNGRTSVREYLSQQSFPLKGARLRQVQQKAAGLIKDDLAGICTVLPNADPAGPNRHVEA
ncbi:hypothetical protein, partial [Clostridium perfringens]